MEGSYVEDRAPKAAPARVSVDRILHPRSVAVFGASENVDKFGGRIMHFLIRHEFPGDVFPINPKRDEVAGRRAVAKIGDLQVAPDLAILAVPAEYLLASLTDAAEAGVGCCVIISTGFAEAGEAGMRLQAALSDVSARSGMRIVGPNCMGLIVPHHRMALCSSIVLDTDTLGDGSIGLISQSGALMVSMFDRAKADGIGLRYGVSLGNQCDLEICDFLEYMIEEPETKVICLYIEGLVNGPRFQAAVAACRRADKPLLLVKTGRTEAGSVAARSHTASLAGSYEALAAICLENGAVLANDPDAMVRAAHLLAQYPGRRRGGVAVVSPSGGSAGIASDRLAESRLPLATLTTATLDRLGQMLLPPQARNPVDFGGKKVPETVEIVGEATRILLNDPNVAYGLAVLTTMPFYTPRSVLVAEAARDSGKPAITVFTPGAAADAARAELRKRGLFYLDSFEDALRVLRLIFDYDIQRELAVDAPCRPDDLPNAAELRDLRDGFQTEIEVKALLAKYSVPVAREELVASPENAMDAAERLGFPVVLKAVSHDIVHKSDVGAVRVGLTNRGDVAAAMTEMAEILRAALPAARIDGFLIQEFIPGEAEVIVGVRRDPQFGPIVVVGLGGIAVEILDDVAVASAPVSHARAQRMISSLRAAPLLNGARGRCPLDVDAIADVVARLSWLASDLGARLVDLEINPLIVRCKAEGCVAVDGRATFTIAGSKASSAKKPN